MNNSLSDTLASITDVVTEAPSDVLDTASDVIGDIGSTVVAAATSAAALDSAKTGFALVRRYKLAVLGVVLAAGAWRWWNSNDDGSSNSDR